MIESKDLYAEYAPSKKQIAVAVATALVVAVIILFIAVLPAEYGIDPLGTGRMLGLSDLTQASAEPAAAAAIPDATIMPVLEPAVGRDAPKMKGAFIERSGRYNADSREITLDPYDGMEIKYNMKKGAGLVYSWVASAKVHYEFHGEPDITPENGGSDYFESYALDYTDGVTESHGTFVAPSSGVHGWYWENTSDSSVTIRLITAGFYDWVFQNLEAGQSALKPMDAYLFPSHPTVPDERF